MEQFSQNDFKKTRIDEAIRRKKMKRLFRFAVVLTIVGFLTYVGIRYQRWDNQNIPGSTFPSAGQRHTKLDEPLSVPYTSNPPSSGDHYGQQGNWDIYDYEVHDKIFIHNLEHGGIWIAYKPDISKEAIDDLAAIVNKFGKSKLVMAPRSANDADVAVVSWMHVYKFDLISSGLTAEQKKNIETFYARLKNRGPEQVPDFMPGINPKDAQ